MEEHKNMFSLKSRCIQHRILHVLPQILTQLTLNSPAYQTHKHVLHVFFSLSFAFFLFLLYFFSFYHPQSEVEPRLSSPSQLKSNLSPKIALFTILQPNQSLSLLTDFQKFHTNFTSLIYLWPNPKPLSSRVCSCVLNSWDW